MRRPSFKKITARWQSFKDKQQAAQRDVPSQIQARIPGDVPAGSRSHLCLFSHWDPHQWVDDYVVHYLEKLVEADCEIVFISTCPRLSASDIERLKPLCREIVIRDNISKDFGSWRIGIHVVGDWSAYQHVVLANDSSYGPFTSLVPLFEAQQASDVWALTDCWDRQYHLQSYFVVLNQRAHQHAFFADFWQNFQFTTLRESIVDRYEVGLTQQAIRAGLTVNAVYDYQQVRDYVATSIPGHYQSPLIDKNRPLNANHFFWDVLIRDFHCPIIKVEVLKYNPMDVKSLYQWRSIIKAAAPDYDTELISRHLKRVSTGSHAV
jgi:lipopolysaccharide biosynthesis protein